MNEERPLAQVIAEAERWLSNAVASGIDEMRAMINRGTASQSRPEGNAASALQAITALTSRQ